MSMTMEEVVELVLGPPVSQSGEWSWWKCPLHQDSHPSLGVADGAAHCFQCGGHWGPLAFLTHKDLGNMARAVALELVGAATGLRRSQSVQMKLPPLPPDWKWRQVVEQAIQGAGAALANSVPARGELESRKIAPATWERYDVGWHETWEELELPNGEHWYAGGHVLVSSYRGKVWDVVVRTGRKKPKYLEIKGGSPCPFGLEQLQGKETLYICEGPMDALTAASAIGDVGDVLALCGASKGLGPWQNILIRYVDVVLCLDGDEAGIAATQALQGVYPEWQKRTPPPGLDLGKMAQGGQDIRMFLLEGSL